MKMKYLLLFVAAVFSVIISHSQMSLGVKGGLNLATISGEYVDGYNPKAGLHIGGYANLSMTKNLSVQGEVMYSMQGAKWEGGGKSSLNYLQIPVLARYNFTPQVFAEAGPQIGFLVSAKDAYEGESVDIKEYLEKTDFSIAVGGGYNINPKLAVYARYNLGLTNIYISEKNRVFQVGVSYALK